MQGRENIHAIPPQLRRVRIAHHQKTGVCSQASPDSFLVVHRIVHNPADTLHLRKLRQIFAFQIPQDRLYGKIKRILIPVLQAFYKPVIRSGICRPDHIHLISAFAEPLTDFIRCSSQYVIR
jgi:hypothetical protein